MEYKSKVFSELELKGESFENCIFIHCCFSKVNLRFTSFKSCTFESCDFSCVEFDGTSFELCSFPGSKLSNLSFADTSIKSCDFSKAIMKYAVFEKQKIGSMYEKQLLQLSSTRFDNADLTGAIFIKCKLIGASFNDSMCTNVVFEACNLKDADFTGASIDGINLTDSKVENTVLDMRGFLTYGASKGFVLSQSFDDRKELV